MCVCYVFWEFIPVEKVTLFCSGVRDAAHRVTSTMNPGKVDNGLIHAVLYCLALLEFNLAIFFVSSGDLLAFMRLLCGNFACV